MSRVKCFCNAKLTFLLPDHICFHTGKALSASSLPSLNSVFFLAFSQIHKNTHRAITHPSIHSSHLLLINALENYPVKALWLRRQRRG